MEAEVSQECLAKSFHCSKCTLIFKSNLYLFEHLNKVHCLDIDASLRDAGLKYAEGKKSKSESNTSAGKSFTCRNCDFKTNSRDALTKHEKQCQKTDSPDAAEPVVTPVPLANQCNEAEPSSSKDLRTYKRPSQTITKYFTASSGSIVKLKTANDEKESPILDETLPRPNSHQCASRKVTTKYGIDISCRTTDCFLPSDHVFHTKQEQSDAQGEGPKTTSIESGRKNNSENLKGPKTKKAKLEEEDKDKTTENKNGENSGSTEFAFEVSDEEEERKLEVVNRERTKVYYCKHCDYSNVSLRLVSSHYQTDHPYVRCKAGYIEQLPDESATFRCLECPIEFQSTVDLKWHYTEKHPNAPDVFRIKVKELRLGFKCFTCTFTCKERRVLREHCREKHPTLEVDNSLLFCQYSVSEHQEEQPQQRTCEGKTVGPGGSVDLSPQKTSTAHIEEEITSSAKPSASTGPDVTQYKCSKCKFEHKSAVVMHVHYQKKHPEKYVTIDEIKQSARETSQIIPEILQREKAEVHLQEKDAAFVVKLSPKCSSDLRIEHEEDGKKGKSSSKLIRNTLNRLENSETVPSQTAKHQPELSLQKGVLSQSDHASNATKESLEFSTSEHVKSTKNESKATMSPSNPNTETTESKPNKFPWSSPLEMHYCQFCDYANPQIRSVIGHHNAKHSARVLLSKEEIIQYSAEVIENKLKSPTIFNTTSNIEISNKTEAQLKIRNTEKTEDHVQAEKLFYCHLCNFGNPSAQGVITHQSRVHKYPYSSRKRILKYTALIHEKIKRSKSQGKNATYSTNLPPPIVNQEDKDMFFCYTCNFRGRELAAVVHHYSKAHHRASNRKDILQYTSKVLKQLHLPENQELLEKSESTKETNNSSATFSSSEPPSVVNSQTQRKLPCKYCKFTTQYVFLLRSHMRKMHFSKPSVSAVLRLCFRKGALLAGYHCEWCVFSHKKAEAVHKHYQERHPGCEQISLANVKSRLYVGPQDLHSEDMKTELKSVQAVTSTYAEKNPDEYYKCTECTFESYTAASLKNHCNKFHPLPVKDVLDSSGEKGTSEKSQLEDLNDMPGLFESFQMPIEDADEENSSSEGFKCPLCPATFHSKHGLSVHSGIKHINFSTKEPKIQAKESQGRVHVFKCPFCSYVNTSCQGVHTHCQRKHPASSVTSLHLDAVPLQDLDENLKNNSGDALKFSGYMCTTCRQLCATLDKLKRHREKDHDEAEDGIPKPASEPSLSLRIKLAKPHRSVGSICNTSNVTKKVYIRIKCKHCSYVSSTNIGMNKHMLEKHRTAPPQDHIYKCALCSQTYSFKKRLSKHYTRTHGKTAYLKYYLPVYKPASKTREPSSQEQQKNLEKRLIYKCASCPYVNVTYHGTLTHSQMKHPSVTVRADELEMGEILVSSIVGCSNGKGSYERGYLCKQCLQIYPSIKKLTAHYEREHRKVSELFAEPAAEKQDKSLVADEAAGLLRRTLHFSVNLQSEEEKPAASDDASSQPAIPSPARSKALLKRDIFYKCQMCTYSAFTRKNLQCHYKSSHKLDALNTYKMLERYNKRKNNYIFKYMALQKRSNLICKVCPESIFDSPQLLIDHYNTFHRLSSKSDFAVVSFGVKKGSTGLYKCKYCKVILYGTRKLCTHLNRHRDQIKAKASQKTNFFIRVKADPKSPRASQRDEIPTFESIEHLSQWTGKPVEVVTLPSNPQQSPSKPPGAETQEGGHTCKRCQRTFMSLKGLRSHERSHAALGAIKKLDNMVNTEFKHNIKKYLIHKPETSKPYRCSCCAYRTNFMALWQSHFMKNHQDVIEKEILETNSKKKEISQSGDKDAPDSSEKTNIFSELIEEPEDIEESTESYSEPPDVQRQLTHYSLMARNVDKASMNLHVLSLSDGLLQCEMCNFNTEHLSSIRRHYSNRHGKKILRCKDCEFYTGLRKNMEMHIETGHSTCQSKPTYLKDLRCPFCLYQTKNRNNMIDHIVLHREQRVTPIEVRRPKLSRYLQGIVFRCHKCTFTSGTADNLRLHMMRHDDVKPYKCRLCYFDCARLAGLEAHLSDKHQVLRNHELVGQVSLELLAARTGTQPQKEENSSDSEEPEAEQSNADNDDAPQTDDIPECHSTENMIQDAVEQKENERMPSNGSVSDVKQEIARHNTTVLNLHQQDSQKQEQNAKEQQEINAIPDAEECNDVNSKRDDCSFAKKEGETSNNQTTMTDGEIEKVPEKSSVSGKKGEVKATYCRIQSIKAMVEDEIVRNVLELDGNRSNHRLHKRPHQERTAKMGPNKEDNTVEEEKSKRPLSSCSTSSAQNPNFQDGIGNPATAKASSARGKGSKHRETFKFEPHLLTLSPSYTRLKLGQRGSLERLLPNCKWEQKQTPKIIKDEPEPQRETLPDERVKEEQNEGADRIELTMDGEVQFNKDRCKIQETPHVHDDVFAPSDGAAEMEPEEKLFTCELCGRTLTNISELKRHVLRHGV